MRVDFINREDSTVHGLKSEEIEEDVRETPWFRKASEYDLHRLNVQEYDSPRCLWLHRQWEWINQNEAIRSLFQCSVKAAKYAVAVPCLVFTLCSLLYGASLATGVLISEIAFSKPYLVKDDNERATIMGQFVFTPIVGCMIFTTVLGLFATCLIGTAMGLSKRQKKTSSKDSYDRPLLEAAG